MFQNGNPVVDLVVAPGLVYLIDGVIPGHPWYKPHIPEMNCQYIRMSNLSDLENAVILIMKGDGIDRKFDSCLREKGILFPENYLKIGDSIKHYRLERDIEIWVPKHLYIDNKRNAVGE